MYPAAPADALSRDQHHSFSCCALINKASARTDVHACVRRRAMAPSAHSIALKQENTMQNFQGPGQVLPKGIYFLGTELADSISGTDYADEIHGLGGNDSIFSGAGDDKLFGDAGKDTLAGG